MNRYILGEMEKIFDTLKAHVDDDDKGRILNVKRHISPAGEAVPVCNFVRTALKKIYPVPQSVLPCSNSKRIVICYWMKNFEIHWEKSVMNLKMMIAL